MKGTETTHNIKWKTLIGMVAATQLVGFAGALFTGLGTMRMRLETWSLPWFTPSRMVFMVVWPCLYFLVAIAGYLAMVHARDHEADAALKLYWAQLVMNCLWQPVFFRFQLLWPAAAWLTVLLALIVACMIKLSHVRRAAGLCMLPYFLWCGFALLLNISIAYLNA